MSNLAIVELTRSLLPSAVWDDSIQVVRLGPDVAVDSDQVSPFLGVYRPIDPTRAVLIDLETCSKSQSLALRNILNSYPIQHPVWAITLEESGEGRVEATTVGSLSQAFSSRPVFGLYVEAVDRLADRRSADTLSYIVARLRAPDGCPWDREQDYDSIKKYLLEETYEAVAAVDERDYVKFSEELGDVLLQVVMYSQLAREAGDFTMEDVLFSVNEKLIRRHPHVFGDVELRDSAEVLKNWEKIKRSEQAETPGSFSGIPDAAPALMRAEAIQSRAERHGWDRPAPSGFVDLIESAGANRDARLVALGDVLFDLVAVARRYHLDPEEALRLATNRFRDNFDRAEVEHPDR